MLSCFTRSKIVSGSAQRQMIVPLDLISSNTPSFMHNPPPHEIIELSVGDRIE